jgi:hypothetical protein
MTYLLVDYVFPGPARLTPRPPRALGQNDCMSPLSRSELLLIDPNDFVARRNDLARELRAQGDKDGAAEVKGLRRPSVAVWALNQVAHEHSELAHQLVDAAHAAEGAQRALLEGNAPDDFRAVVTRRRDAMTAVAAAASVVIERSGRTRDANARDIDTALNAIVASSDALDMFARAELIAIPDASGETEMFAGITLPESTRAAPAASLRALPARTGPNGAPAALPAAERPQSARLTKAREQLAQHREALSSAEHDLQAAEAVVADASDQLALARRGLQRAEADRDRVRAHVERAQEQVARSAEVVGRYES